MVDIKGYEGLYAVTTCGKVWSYRRNRFMKGSVNHYGYLYSPLYKDGKAKNHYIHRLVAEAYIDNPEVKPQVNHINGIKIDNCIGNLEWNTVSENIKHAYDKGLMHMSDEKKKAVIEGCSKPVFQIDARTGDIIKGWKSATDAGKSLGISSISSACTGRNITAGGYIWRTVLNYDCEKDKENLLKNSIRKNEKSVIQIDKKTKEVIAEWKSASEAGRSLNITRQAISEACKGEYRTAGGYIWRFK
jgi:hypothetical protein